jgi:rubrerythrin
MNIFDFAINMEKEGEEYYRQLADQASEEGLKRILNRMADDEVKHYLTFEAMKNEEQPEFSDTVILKDAKEVFSQITMDTELKKSDASQLEVYKKAQEMELKSEEFYCQEAAKIRNEDHKKLLLKIAEEEKKHYFLLQNIIDFISRPQKWIENAEFYKLDDY